MILGIVGIVLILMFLFPDLKKSVDDVLPREERVVVDERSGKEYPYKKIGEQFWFTENLAVGSDEIEELEYREGKGDWSNAGEEGVPAYAVYNNDEKNKENYGYLYNFYAVELLDLCPQGWSVPSDEDWHQLESYLKEEGVSCNSQRVGSLGCDPAGAKIKAYHEDSDGEWNRGEFNCSGGEEYECTEFNTLPSGSRYTSGTYFGLSSSAYFWTSSVTEEEGLFRNLREARAGVLRNKSSKGMGMSVRCVRE